MKRVAFVTRFDTSIGSRVPALGGAGLASYHIARTFDELALCVVNVTCVQSNTYVARLKQRYYQMFFNQEYNTSAEPLKLKGEARKINDQLDKLDCDIVLSRVVLPLAFVKTKLPLVVWTDGAAMGLLDFYPQLTNLSQRSRSETLAFERAALQRCKLVVYSSEWAANHAPKDLPRSKIRIVPFGANFESKLTRSEVFRAIEARPTDRCSLVFIGSSWMRKGGPLALEVATAINAAGLPCTLSVVGCKPREPMEHFNTSVEFTGRLDLATTNGRDRLASLLLQAHFLILPSRADCSPHVLAEANSFGVPCLTTRVGGIPSMIRNELNGKLFPLNAKAHVYRDYTLSVLQNAARYKELARSSFDEFETRLNWKVSCEQMLTLMKPLVSSSSDYKK